MTEFANQSLSRAVEAGSAVFSRSATGSTTLTGKSALQKYVWTISTYLKPDEALNIKDMFEAWDFDRSEGRPAACGLVDTCFGPTIATSVIFTTPPSFRKASPHLYQVDFALTEV